MVGLGTFGTANGRARVISIGSRVHKITSLVSTTFPSLVTLERDLCKLVILYGATPESVTRDGIFVSFQQDYSGACADFNLVTAWFVCT